MFVLSVRSSVPRALPGAALAAALASSACANEYHPEYRPESSYTVNQSVSYPTIYQLSTPAPSVVTNPSVMSPPSVTYSTPAPRTPASDPSRVVIVESPHLDRPAEVIGVVDVEDTTGSHEAALVQLKHRAAEMGADAVAGVEFHPTEKGPTHVSGLAIRFLRTRR